MTTIAELRSDDRAVSATVTHALALGITAILISGLLLSAGSMLLDQRENSAREQLRTVGNRIAGDLARAATLAQDGGNVNISSRQPGSIAGRNYQVTFLTGSDCDTDLFTTDACLRLTLQGGQPSVMVPIRNETAVDLEVGSRGRYTVSAAANGSAERPPPATKRNLKVGIGNTTGEYGSFEDVNLTNRDPIAGFTFTPGTPTTLSVIQFQNDTEDLDGVIESYEWNFNDNLDDTIDATGRTVNHSYSTPGKYTVTLTVTDDDGETDSVSKVVSVGGLVYRGNLHPVNVSPSLVDGGLQFEIENLHGSEVEIQQVLIDPADDSIDYLDDEGHGSDNEVEIDGDETGHYEDSEPIQDGGGVFDLESGLADADVARLSPGNDADVTFRGFDTDTDGSSKTDMAGEKVFVAMRYEVGGSFYTAQFTLNGGVPTNDAPNADFTYTCTDMACTFTDASTVNGGSIDDWEWNFDHDNQTATGKGPHTHTFPENETYLVSLTVNESGVTSTKTKAVTFTNYSDPVILAVNAGGSEVEVGGITYAADSASSEHPDLYEDDDSTVGSTSDSISGLPSEHHQDLYQSVRYGDDPDCYPIPFIGMYCTDSGYFGYDVDDVPNGEYEITFRFAEILDSDQIDPDSPGDRVFDVNVNGNEAIDDLDVYENVSDVDRALTITTTAEVTGRGLDIQFEPESNEEPPMVSAVVARLVDADAFQRSSDRFVMEAESYHTRESGADADGVDMGEDEWDSTDWGDDAEDDASDGEAMEVEQDDNGDTAGDTTNGPRLDYYVDVEGSETGTYYVWVRMRCDGVQDEGVHVGLDGQPATYGANGLNGTGTTACHDEYDDWMWASEFGGQRATLQMNSAGQHTVNVWAYRDGVQIDKVVVTTDASYTPTDDGPSESTVG